MSLLLSHPAGHHEDGPGPLDHDGGLANVPHSPIAAHGTSTTHLFAGGLGDLLGFLEAGFDPQYAANHDAAAISTLRMNFPGVRYSRCDINNLDFRSIPRTRVAVGSPICKEASPAGRNSTASQRYPQNTPDGGAPEPQWSRTRATAWDLLRAAEVHDYDVVCGENVVDFATRWKPFVAWIAVWDAMGYDGQLVSIDAAHISGPGNEAAPQHRHRVLFVFTKKGLPAPDLRVRPRCICPECGPVDGVQEWGKRFRPGVLKVGTYGQQYRYRCPDGRCRRQVEPVTRSIREHIDLSEPGRLVGQGRPNRRNFKPYAEETRRKIAIGMERFGDEPFLAILRNHCTVQSLDEPIGAITAEGNHHMLVKPGRTINECEVKMISLRTKARAQRFPDQHRFGGSRAADLTRQVGNAVPVNVARWLGERIAPVLV
ncbi:DNA cytosine methyltransferase [Streptomyces parvus]|uniref:DNA cytosine methyltransferase n=1 Tax=Streptomyces parvus TaxID=66428 RepID=UPI0021010884|nr:DNA cytosine methyltransferase [Streptomyces parvus]MCQ1581209.1 DNA cytosine methyltransferase [Streptomyces parvus]